MSPESRKIVPLPDEVAAQISASKTISSLDSVVLGLVENSIDALASRVTVTIDFRRGSCLVEDDGEGIPAQEFQEAGGLGKPYCMAASQHEVVD